MNGNNTDTILSVTNLSKSYKNFKAVDNLNFEVKRGEIFGFLGPNGAGKSTTISMISGLINVDSGDIMINGVSLKSEPKKARQMLGVCPQDIVIWNELTCMEQIRFMGSMYNLSEKEVRERGINLLKALELMDKKDKLAKTLSGGMKRRLNIILSLIHDPELVILDEPEAGLDPQSKVLVRNYIMSLSKQKTVLLTTHNMDEADRVASRVAIIDRGKLLVIDKPENLKKNLGEGDLLEVNVLEADNLKIKHVKDELQQIAKSLSFVNNTLSIVSPDILDKIPNIKNILQKNQIKIEDIRLRKRTLEDVFINLTGRELRE